MFPLISLKKTIKKHAGLTLFFDPKICRNGTRTRTLNKLNEIRKVTIIEP